MSMFRNETRAFSVRGLLVGSFSVLSIASTPLAVLAQTAPNITAPTVVMPEPDAPITSARTRALTLFKALTGISIPIDDPRLKQMESLIQSGKEREAVKVATADPLFYNIRVRDMARKMSTIDESVRAPLSDFVATFVGVVRDSDSTSAKELLTGNFTYQADPALTMVDGQQKVRSDALQDLIESNRHYEDIENNNFSLHAVLKRVDGQKVVFENAQQAVVDHPDPAGLLTTRAWVAAHSVAGTNRRLVEFSFKQFMCTPITEFADATSPDDRVGRDVDRQPSGSASKYLTTCKACHGNMDGFRGAFAKVNFNGRPTYNSTGVVGKMNRNGNQFPGGFVTRDDSFVNYANVGKNAEQFGWRSPTSTGQGMKQFGAMLASSQGFSRCMVKRVFATVCKRPVNPSEETMVRKMADDFEASNHHMRNLFEAVALRPECLKSI